MTEVPQQQPPFPPGCLPTLTRLEPSGGGGGGGSATTTWVWTLPQALQPDEISAGPVLVGSSLVLLVSGTTGRVFGLDREVGTLLWYTVVIDGGTAAEQAPLFPPVVTKGGRVLAIGYNSSHLEQQFPCSLVAVDASPAAGVLAWTVPLPACGATQYGLGLSLAQDESAVCLRRRRRKRWVRLLV